MATHRSEVAKYINSHGGSAHQLVQRINDQIDGRVCMSKYLHALYSLREWMGNRCSKYVEIGCLFGGSLALVMQDPSACDYIAIDLFTGYYGMNIPKGTQGSSQAITAETHLSHTKKNIEKFNVHGKRFDLVKGSSYAPETVEQVVELLDGKPIDLLFIDGDHSKLGVKRDFQAYAKMVSSGGFVVFDN